MIFNILTILFINLSFVYVYSADVSPYVISLAESKRGDSVVSWDRYYIGAGIDLWEIDPKINSFSFGTDTWMPQSQAGSKFEFDNYEQIHTGKLFVAGLIQAGPSDMAGVLVGSEVLAINGITVSSIRNGSKEKWFYNLIKTKSKNEQINLRLKKYSTLGLPMDEYSVVINLDYNDQLSWSYPNLLLGIGTNGFYPANDGDFFARYMWQYSNNFNTFTSELLIGVEKSKQGSNDKILLNSKILSEISKAPGCENLQDNFLVEPGKMIRLKLDFKAYPVTISDYFDIIATKKYNSNDGFDFNVGDPLANIAISMAFPVDGIINHCEVTEETITNSN